MSQDNPIVISVPFHGDTITAIETPEGVMVAVRPICERLGIDWSRQLRRLKESETHWRGGHMSTPSAGGAQETYCIPLTRLAAWLFSINANKVRADLREGLIRYQSEAADVLDRHFRLRAAETSARIEEQEKMLWHAGQHLRITNAKWDRAYLLMEMGATDYLIAQRLGWSLARWQEEKEMMKSCGLNPKWREDMETLQEQVADLRWRLERATRQGELFGNA